MAEIPTFMLPHRVTVQPYEGSGAMGDVFGTGIPDVPCMLDDTRKLVRDPEGVEVVSETTLVTRRQYAGKFEPGSRVTLPRRTATVISCAERTDGGMGGWQHLEVVLS